MNGFIQWVKSIWSEPNGAGSSTRVITTSLVAFVIFVGLSFSVAVHLKKITMDQFDQFLSAGSLFIVTTCAPLYATNKVADAYKDKTSKDNQ